MWERLFYSCPTGWGRQRNTVIGGEHYGFKPSQYTIENAIKEAIRYNGGIYVGDNYVTKDHGDYIEVNIDCDNPKGHDSINIYFDAQGKMVKAEPHRTNTVFVKTLHF